METRKEALVRIVGSENLVDDPAVLAAYAKDESLVSPLVPWFVARPANADEVQRLVLWANATGTPLVAVSSGPPHFHGDTVPSAPEAVIVDLGRMKAIKRIDRRNRIAVIEPGVTYSELDAALSGARSVRRPAAVAATQQVGRGEPPRAATDARSAPPLFVPRAAAHLRRGLGDGRNRLHRRSRWRTPVAGGPVVTGHGASRPEGAADDRPDAAPDRRAGIDGHRGLGVDPAPALARGPPLPLRAGTGGRRFARVLLQARTDAAGRRGGAAQRRPVRAAGRQRMWAMRRA